MSECPICFDEIGSVNTCTTPCGHTFCFKCMFRALSQNNACPCCRSQLRETEAEEEVEDDEESDDETDEDSLESEGDDNVGRTWACPERIAERFTAEGYNMTDVIAVFLERKERSDPEKNTAEYFQKMEEIFENILDEEDHESYDEYSERINMGEEDQPARIHCRLNGVSEHPLDRKRSREEPIDIEPLNLAELFQYE